MNKGVNDGVSSARHTALPAPTPAAPHFPDGLCQPPPSPPHPTRLVPVPPRCPVSPHSGNAEFPRAGLGHGSAHESLPFQTRDGDIAEVTNMEGGKALLGSTPSGRARRRVGAWTRRPRLQPWTGPQLAGLFRRMLASQIRMISEPFLVIAPLTFI